MILDKLQLLTGVDAIVHKYDLTMRQLTISEIANIGEKKFFNVLEIFVVDLDKLRLSYFNSIQEDKTDKPALSVEQLFLALLTRDVDIFGTFLYLMFLMNPNIQIQSNEDRLFFFLKNEKEETSSDTQKMSLIDSSFLMDLREIFKEMFQTEFFFPTTKGSEFNPSNEQAAKIAAKLKEQKEKVNNEKHGNVVIESLLSLIISMLSTSSSALTLDELSNYTVYKLVNQFERGRLFKEYGESLNAIYAGAKDIEIVDWTIDI